MARINISIPDELQSMMNQLDDVNWSAVAQRAFQIEVNTRTKGKNMESAVQRLKASREKFIYISKEKWISAGRKWASEDASYQQLRKIPEIQEDQVQFNYCCDDLLKLVVSIWAGGKDVSKLDVSAFKILFGGEGVEMELKYLEWWVEGAMSVWEAYVESL